MKDLGSTIHNEKYRQLVRRLVELRRIAELSQKALAEALGLDQPDISKIENFERRLDALELMLWLKVVSPNRYALVEDALSREGKEDGR